MSFNKIFLLLLFFLNQLFMNKVLKVTRLRSLCCWLCLLREGVFERQTTFSVCYR